MLLFTKRKKPTTTAETPSIDPRSRNRRIRAKSRTKPLDTTEESASDQRTTSTER